jgi:peptidoglycan-associated lipoprotein
MSAGRLHKSGEQRRIAIGMAAAVLFNAAVFAQSSKWYDPYQKGLKAFEASNWAQAAAFLEQAAAAAPQAAAHKYLEGVFRVDYFPYYFLGAAYLELHQYEKAQRNINKASDGLSPDLIPKLIALQARLDTEKPVIVLAGGTPPAVPSAPASPAGLASPAARTPPAPPPPTPLAASSAPLSEDDVFARKSVDQVNAERPLDDVYFDSGKSEIPRNGKVLLQRDADWLKRWTSTRITVEGRCDARGSVEQNLTLGLQRAAAVKSYLVSLGVPGNRITVVSKGKEQPFCDDKNESCWQENRRGHFLITEK